MPKAFINYLRFIYYSVYSPLVLGVLVQESESVAESESVTSERADEWILSYEAIKEQEIRNEVTY